VVSAAPRRRAPPQLIRLAYPIGVAGARRSGGWTFFLCAMWLWRPESTRSAAEQVLDRTGHRRCPIRTGKRCRLAPFLAPCIEPRGARRPPLSTEVSGLPWCVGIARAQRVSACAARRLDALVWTAALARRTDSSQSSLRCWRGCASRFRPAWTTKRAASRSAPCLARHHLARRCRSRSDMPLAATLSDWRVRAAASRMAEA